MIADLRPHRLIVTAVCSLVAIILIIGALLCMVKKNTFLARRRSTQYLVLASVGLLFYVRDNISLVWTYPEYGSRQYNTLLYYIIAVPFHLLPVIVRS